MALKNGRKREWEDEIVAGNNDDGFSGVLAQDLQLDASFLDDPLLDIPNLGTDGFLDIDAGPDAFAGLDLPSSDATATFLPELDPHFPAVAGDSRTGRNGATPSTSESGNLGIALPLSDSAVKGRSSSEEDDQHNRSQRKPPVEEDEAKRLARMQRNRENAHLSRQRKKQQTMELQQACTHLRAQTTQLTCMVHRLVAENCLLRHHLGNACKVANIPVPDVPSAMKAAASKQPTTTASTQASHQAAGVGVGGQVASLSAPLLGGLFASGVQAARPVVGAMPALPAVPVTAPTQPQPVPAATSPPVPVAAAAPQRPQRAKRAKMTGAGAAFLAMFSIFLFAGPFIPTRGPATLGQAALPGPISTGALPAASAGGAWDVGSGHSRSLLQALPPGDTALLEPRRPEQHPPLADMMRDAANELMQDPRNRDLPAKALARLQDLAPAAVVLDPDTVSDSSDVFQNKPEPNVMAVSAAFPTLADQFFKAAGMDAPQTCRKVFEFEAAALPHPIRSRRSVERYIMGTYGFKGRSAGLTAGADASLVVPGIKGPLRLPAASEPSLEDDASSEDALIVPKPVEEPLRIVGSPPEESEDTVADLSEYDGVGGPLALPSMVSEPTLVSILLPANASQPSDGGLSAIDRVFVVLLHPQDKFVTYSCGLSRSILV